MAENIIIYTKPGCPYCAAVKEDMTRKKMAYKEIDVYQHPEVQSEVEKLAGRRAVPVIVKDGKVTVGFGGT